MFNWEIFMTIHLSRVRFLVRFSYAYMIELVYWMKFFCIRLPHSMMREHENRIGCCFTIIYSFVLYFCFVYLQMHQNIWKNSPHTSTVETSSVVRKICVSIIIAWTFYAWAKIVFYAKRKKSYAIWNGIRNGRRVCHTAFCVSHPATIVPHNSSIANTIADKRIIIVCNLTVTRSILAQAMYKCIPTTTARIRPFSKKGMYHII